MQALVQVSVPKPLFLREEGLLRSYLPSLPLGLGLGQGFDTL